MIKITLSIMMIIFSFALASMINAEEGEEYNLTEKVCSDYDGKWDDEKEICKIEDEEEKAAYEDYICEEPEDYDRYPKICKPWLFED